MSRAQRQLIAFTALLATLLPVAAGAQERTLVQIPEDMEIDSLPARRAAQIEAVSRSGVFHGFGFTDRREASGITFQHQIVDDAGRHYKMVHYDHGNGLAAADVDSDGLTDLYFTTQLGSNELWRNLGDGRFENVTERAGVGLDDRVSVSASFADVDNDGDPDLFVTTVRMGNALLVNNGKGVFKDVTERAGLSYSGHSSSGLFFDYDNDGLLDLLLLNVGVYTIDQRGRGGYFVGIDNAFTGQLIPGRSERSILYRNLGGRFEDVSEKSLLMDWSWSGDATAADFNGDGFQDLYVLNMQGPDHYYQNIQGRFFVDKTADLFPRTPPGTMGVKAFDWNGDGRLDLMLTDMHADMNEEIGPEREKAKARVTAAVPEKELARSILGNAFWENTVDGFREISDQVGAENYWPWGVSVDDLNADGWDDVFIASSMNYPFRYGVNSLLLNDRGRTFLDSEFVLGVEPRAGSLVKPWFDVDCPADTVDAPPATDPLTRGAEPCRGSSGPITVMASRGTRSSVIFDLEGDGDLDIVTHEFFDRPQVLVSDLAAKKQLRYLTVKLVGTVSNRDGLGARVTVTAGGRSRVKVHDGKSGYLSQSALPLYFGLGDAEAVERIEVTWPSGREQRLEKPAIGGRIEIVEPHETLTPGPLPEGEGAVRP